MRIIELTTIRLYLTLCLIQSSIGQVGPPSQRILPPGSSNEESSTRASFPPVNRYTVTTLVPPGLQASIVSAASSTESSQTPSYTAGYGLTPVTVGKTSSVPQTQSLPSSAASSIATASTSSPAAITRGQRFSAQTIYAPSSLPVGISTPGNAAASTSRTVGTHSTPAYNQFTLSLASTLIPSSSSRSPPTGYGLPPLNAPSAVPVGISPPSHTALPPLTFSIGSSPPAISPPAYTRSSRLSAFVINATSRSSLRQQKMTDITTTSTTSNAVPTGKGSSQIQRTTGAIVSDIKYGAPADWASISRPVAANDRFTLSTETNRISPPTLDIAAAGIGYGIPAGAISGSSSSSGIGISSPSTLPRLSTSGSSRPAIGLQATTASTSLSSTVAPPSGLPRGVSSPAGPEIVTAVNGYGAFTILASSSSTSFSGTSVSQLSTSRTTRPSPADTSYFAPTNLPPGISSPSSATATAGHGYGIPMSTAETSSTHSQSSTRRPSSTSFAAPSNVPQGISSPAPETSMAGNGYGVVTLSVSTSATSGQSISITMTPSTLRTSVSPPSNLPPGISPPDSETSITGSGYGIVPGSGSSRSTLVSSTRVTSGISKSAGTTLSPNAPSSLPRGISSPAPEKSSAGSGYSVGIGSTLSTESNEITESQSTNRLQDNRSRTPQSKLAYGRYGRRSTTTIAAPSSSFPIGVSPPSDDESLADVYDLYDLGNGPSATSDAQTDATISPPGLLPLGVSAPADERTDDDIGATETVPLENEIFSVPTRKRVLAQSHTVGISKFRSTSQLGPRLTTPKSRGQSHRRTTTEDDLTDSSTAPSTTRVVKGKKVFGTGRRRGNGTSKKGSGKKLSHGLSSGRGKKVDIKSGIFPAEKPTSLSAKKRTKVGDDPKARLPEPPNPQTSSGRPAPSRIHSLPAQSQVSGSGSAGRSDAARSLLRPAELYSTVADGSTSGSLTPTTSTTARTVPSPTSTTIATAQPAKLNAVLSLPNADAKNAVTSISAPGTFPIGVSAPGDGRTTVAAYFNAPAPVGPPATAQSSYQTRPGTYSSTALYSSITAPPGNLPPGVYPPSSPSPYKASGWAAPGNLQSGFPASYTSSNIGVSPARYDNPPDGAASPRPSASSYGSQSEDSNAYYGPSINPNCVDVHPKCDYFASNGKCVNPRFSAFVRQVCPRSCSACEGGSAYGGYGGTTSGSGGTYGKIGGGGGQGYAGGYGGGGKQYGGKPGLGPGDYYFGPPTLPVGPAPGPSSGCCGGGSAGYIPGGSSPCDGDGGCGSVDLGGTYGGAQPGGYDGGVGTGCGADGCGNPPPANYEGASSGCGAGGCQLIGGPPSGCGSAGCGASAGQTAVGGQTSIRIPLSKRKTFGRNTCGCNLQLWTHSTRSIVMLLLLLFSTAQSP